MKIYRLIIATVLIFGWNFHYSQDKENKWHEATPMTVIPDSLQSEDAIMLINHVTVVNDLFAISRRHVYQKIKILTKDGLDEYGKIFITKFTNEEIDVMDARTIKSDGSIIDLNRDDIKILDFKNEYYDRDVEHLRFSIPGIEIGDEIEIVYQFIGPTYSKDFFFHSRLPTLSSKLTFQTDRKVITDVVSQNGLPDPEVKSTPDRTSYTWEIKNIASIEGQDYAIKSKELPYATIVIRAVEVNIEGNTRDNKRPVISNSWPDLYDKLYGIINNQLKGSGISKGAYQDMLVDLIGPKSNRAESDKFKNLYNLVKHIQDNIKVVALSKEEAENSMDYFVYNKKIDPDNMMSLYKEIFESLKVKYFLCFARNRYYGEISMDFVTTHGLSDFFFAFRDQNETLHFLYPSQVYQQYKIDELPSEIENTKMIMVHRPYLESKNSEIEYIQLPSSNAEDNLFSNQHQVKINFNNDTTVTKSRISMKGAYSSNYRSDFLKSLEENDHKSLSVNELIDFVDTSYLIKSEPYYPFNFSFGYEHNWIIPKSKIDTNLYSIQLDAFLLDERMDIHNSDRFMHYYPLHLSTNQQRFYLTFSEEINLVNEEKLNTMLKNNVGEFNITVKKVNNNTIYIDFAMAIISENISPSDFGKMKTLNDAYIEALNATLILEKL